LDTYSHCVWDFTLIYGKPFCTGINADCPFVTHSEVKWGGDAEVTGKMCRFPEEGLAF